MHLMQTSNLLLPFVQEWEDKKVDEVKVKDPKGKEETPDKKTAPYWFEDGNLLFLRYTLIF